MGFHNNYLGFFKCFTGWPADTNNSTPEPVRLISAWEGDSPAFSMYIVTASKPRPRAAPGVMGSQKDPLNPCGHWYPLISKGLGLTDLGDLVSKYSKELLQLDPGRTWNCRSSQHVWCSACWTCGPPEAWQMLNWCIYVPFCFSMKVHLHLYVHFIILYVHFKLGCSDVPCHHLGLSKR